MPRPTSPIAVTVATLVCCLGAASGVLAASLPKALAPLEFLLGEWEGGGGGAPGKGSGGTTFATGLQDRVILRTNYAVVAATEKAAASRHDDLMVIYADEKGGARADYYDNEGHVIRYRVTSPGTGRAVFLSEPLADGSIYRLTYESATGGTVKGAFSVGSPRSPDVWTTYLSWELRRVAR